MALAFALGTLPATATAQATGGAPINMTGTWETANEGFYAKLRQTGDVITGKNPPGPAAHFTRGAWNQGALVLVVLWDPESGRCARSTLVLAGKGTIAAGLDGMWYNSEGSSRGDHLSRTSSDPGEPVEYPYAKELKACGDLLAYELIFDTASATLKGSDWPILNALTALLKQDAALKVRVVGHTDSTGDAAQNKALSLARAEAVKKALLAKSGMDPGRVVTEGMGQDQPLQDNGTPLGRAMNRRVEISMAR
jgi:outer membrane protein OmpA-like peptidoglycan-associated protein